MFGLQWVKPCQVPSCSHTPTKNRPKRYCLSDFRATDGLSDILPISDGKGLYRLNQLAERCNDQMDEETKKRNKHIL